MGYMRGEMRSGGECARATEMPASAMEAANVNAAAMKPAPTTMKAAATMKSATSPAMKATAMAASTSRAGIRGGGQEYRASKHGKT
jgi:hypothetical protein